MADFLFLYRNTQADAQKYMGTPEAAQASMKLWMAWMADLEAKGHLKSRGEPLERTGRVVTGPSNQVTDGPFAEAKDMVSGFSLIVAKDEAEAIELAKGCPVLRGSGSVEVRPVMKL
ncbi:MAG: transcription initiation protein [Polyangiaceae bacterium]|nr:transcription initiation protein [Polyangiaceae bacterium]